MVFCKGIDQFLETVLKNNIFLSIIVPVYNTPIEILKSCFESVKNQSNTNWELIVVDDGSATECANWIDNYCKDILNKIIIHKHNEGVSVARNEGVKLARGEWITFLDSDNTLPYDTVATYYNVVVSNQTKNTELIIGFSVMCKRTLKNEEDIISFTNQNNEIPIEQKEKIKSGTLEYVENKDELVNHLLSGNIYKWKRADSYFGDGPCGKLIRTDIARCEPFPNHLKWNEDTVWLLNIVAISKDIIILSDIVYNNVEYTYSATRRFRQNCLQEFCDVCEAERVLEKDFPNCKEAFAYKRFVEILLVSRLYFFHKDNTVSEKNRNKEFYVWCRQKTTQTVAKEILRNISGFGIKKFICRFFSLLLFLGMYKFCWLFLKSYNKRF